MKKKIAVIGGGVSGLTAAVFAAGRGAEVALFEAGRVLGGRARAVANPDFSFTDNGQHILIGAYAFVFDLLEKIDIDIDAAFTRVPMQWYMHDGVQFQAARLPEPLDMAVGILRAKNVPFGDKLALLKDMNRLRWHYRRKLPDRSVQSWLDEHRVSRFWREQFWLPLVLGALNTPPATASLNKLCNVLADGIWPKRYQDLYLLSVQNWEKRYRDLCPPSRYYTMFFPQLRDPALNNKTRSDYYLPRGDLGEILAEPAADYILRHGGRIHTQTRVKELVCGNGKVQVEGEWFDAAVIAVAPYHLPPLLPKAFGEEGGYAEWCRERIEPAIRQMRYHAITTVYLRYGQDFRLPAPMTGLVHGTAHWLIDRHYLNGENEIAAVISASDTLSGSLNTADDWASAVHADVLRVCPHLGKPQAQLVLTEKRATAACTPDYRYALTALLHSFGIMVAGDWLHERYPCTLEAAVRSGHQAGMYACVYRPISEYGKADETDQAA